MVEPRTLLIHFQWWRPSVEPLRRGPETRAERGGTNSVTANRAFKPKARWKTATLEGESSPGGSTVTLLICLAQLGHASTRARCYQARSRGASTTNSRRIETFMLHNTSSLCRGSYNRKSMNTRKASYQRRRRAVLGPDHRQRDRPVRGT